MLAARGKCATFYEALPLDVMTSRDDALVAFFERWQRSIGRLQRAYPARWYVPGLSDEEVRDALTLRLLEAAREEDPPPAPAEREWALGIVRRHLALLRKSFRVAAIPMDFRGAVLSPREPDHEQQFLERESDVCRADAAAAAKERLSTPQRRWLAAFKMAANGGQFFEASREPNLSAASRVIGKHRSSAQRAYRELQTHFQRERRRLEK
jgi:hypothetical protein